MAEELPKLAAAIKDLLAVDAEILARGKGKTLLATHWNRITAGLKTVGTTDVPLIIQGSITGVPVPPPNMNTDTTAPLVATGVTPVQISTSRVDITCDPGYDPPVAGYASGMRRSQLYRSVNGGAASPLDRKSTRLNSSHSDRSRMPSSA